MQIFVDFSILNGYFSALQCVQTFVRDSEHPVFPQSTHYVHVFTSVHNTGTCSPSCTFPCMCSLLCTLPCMCSLPCTIPVHSHLCAHSHACAHFRAHYLARAHFRAHSRARAHPFAHYIARGHLRAHCDIRTRAAGLSKLFEAGTLFFQRGWTPYTFIHQISIVCVQGGRAVQMRPVFLTAFTVATAARAQRGQRASGTRERTAKQKQNEFVRFYNV